MSGIIANIFGSQFWESIWDSLGKNGSFYFNKYISSKICSSGGHA